uniref:CCN family member 1 n=1 Tax=Mola mola TaxID=94237 RepID=A0A3Q3WDS3_MOLML
MFGRKLMIRNDCWCPPDNPRCAADVALMLDGCGCYKVCGQQLFEDCNKTQPCDHTKGLECNFGGGSKSVKGICRAKSDGRPCEYNNRIYQNGELFRPNCKHQCTCMDGVVGCVSLCPLDLMPPRLGCAEQRQVRTPGRCCEQLVCPESSVVKKHRKKHSKESRESENDLANRKELTAVWKGEAKSLPAFRSHPIGHMKVRGVKCVPQTKAWSPCSKSCGTGVSTRLTNSNTHCNLTKETRICQIRPCSLTTFNRVKSGHKCKETEKSSAPVKLSYAGCRSLKKFQPKYCGSCSDGRCCWPRRTQTSHVLFRCRNGKITSRMVMTIESCKCSLNCAGSNRRGAALYRPPNDIHKRKI